MQDLNLRPIDYGSTALTAELKARFASIKLIIVTLKVFISFYRYKSILSYCIAFIIVAAVFCSRPFSFKVNNEASVSVGDFKT